MRIFFIGARPFNTRQQMIGHCQHQTRRSSWLGSWVLDIYRVFSITSIIYCCVLSIVGWRIKWKVVLASDCCLSSSLASLASTQPPPGLRTPDTSHNYTLDIDIEIYLHSLHSGRSFKESHMVGDMAAVLQDLRDVVSCQDSSYSHSPVYQCVMYKEQRLAKLTLVSMRPLMKITISGAFFSVINK